MSRRLAIITTHPIQYNAPFFALLALRKKITIKVFYTWGADVLKDKYDPGFGKKINWDIPLLDGYEYTFVNNTSANPGSSHFKGITNPTLNKQVEEWKPDAILVFGWAFSSHLKCIRYFHKKIPVLFRGDSTLLRKQSGAKTILRNLFLKWVYRHVDYALHVGIQNKLYFGKYGLRGEHLVFTPHAIDNARFADHSGEYEKAAIAWKSKLGIEPHELVILYAGKLEDIKEPDIIIQLAAKFKSLPVRFIIVGNGPLEQSLKAASKNNRQIVFLDFQNQLTMPIVYRLGDLFILSSKSETWGLGINEAMASGRGVLVRNTCGCAADLVVDGVNGYMFDAEDIKNLFTKIERLVNNRDQLKNMGNESTRIIKMYSFENIAGTIESLMDKINVPG